MSKRQVFINFVDNLIENNAEKMPDDALQYWEVFKGKDGEKDKSLFTDKGKLILQYLRDNEQTMPLVKAQDVGEGLGMNSRAVSGSMRKLAEDGFISKEGRDPVIYSLTELGKTVEII